MSEEQFAAFVKQVSDLFSQKRFADKVEDMNIARVNVFCSLVKSGVEAGPAMLQSKMVVAELFE